MKKKLIKAINHQHLNEEGIPFGKAHDSAVKHKNKNTQNKHLFTLNYIPKVEEEDGTNRCRN